MQVIMVLVLVHQEHITRTGRVVQVLECLLSKHEALSSNTLESRLEVPTWPGTHNVGQAASNSDPSGSTFQVLALQA
jgi:hypothetical protein